MRKSANGLKWLRGLTLGSAVLSIVLVYFLGLVTGGAKSAVVDHAGKGITVAVWTAFTAVTGMRDLNRFWRKVRGHKEVGGVIDVITRDEVATVKRKGR